VDFRKHSGPTPADDMAPQIITDCGNFTLDFKQLGFCASTLFLQTLGPWFTNELKNILSSEKRTLDHWLSPGKTLLTLSLVQEWLDTSNATVVAHVLDLSVRGGSWCTDSSLSPLLVKLPQIIEWPLLDNPFKAAVIPVACAPFPTTLFPSTQLSMNMLGYSTLWTASFFSNDLLWLTLLVEGVNDCLLDNCQVSSLPHDCVAYWTRLRDHLKAQETFAGVLSSLDDECDSVSLQSWTFSQYSNFLRYWILERHNHHN